MYIAIGYMFGLWLSDAGIFSANLGLTQWDNIWVYAWMLFWPFIVAGHFIFWVLILLVIGLVIWALADKFL